MKWYEYLFVIVLTVFSGAISYGLSYKQIHQPLYVVDLTKLIDDEFSYKDVKDVYNGKIKPEDFIKKKKEYLDKLQDILESFDRPVFVKQAVVGGNTVDITDQVKKYLK